MKINVLSLALPFAIALGCSASVPIHRDSAGVRVTTCDPNRAFRIETEGQTPAEARERADTAIRKRVRELGGCSALVTHGGLGRSPFGFNEADVVQPCSCVGR